MRPGQKGLLKRGDLEKEKGAMESGRNKARDDAEAATPRRNPEDAGKMDRNKGIKDKDLPDSNARKKAAKDTRDGLERELNGAGGLKDRKGKVDKGAEDAARKKQESQAKKSDLESQKKTNETILDRLNTKRKELEGKLSSLFRTKNKKHEHQDGILNIMKGKELVKSKGVKLEKTADIDRFVSTNRAVSEDVMNDAWVS